MRRLEAVADAVAKYHDYWNPESESYDLRNPGMLIGEEGKRKFRCHRAGYASFLDRIQKYCAAHPDETIVSLLDSLGIKMRMQQKQTIDFMSRCANSTLGTEIRLQWFIEEENGSATHTANSSR